MAFFLPVVVQLNPMFSTYRHGRILLAVVCAISARGDIECALKERMQDYILRWEGQNAHHTSVS